MYEQQMKNAGCIAYGKVIVALILGLAIFFYSGLVFFINFQEGRFRLDAEHFLILVFPLCGAYLVAGGLSSWRELRAAQDSPTRGVDSGFASLFGLFLILVLATSLWDDVKYHGSFDLDIIFSFAGFLYSAVFLAGVYLLLTGFISWCGSHSGDDMDRWGRAGRLGSRAMVTVLLLLGLLLIVVPGCFFLDAVLDEGLRESVDSYFHLFNISFPLMGLCLLVAGFISWRNLHSADAAKKPFLRTEDEEGTG